MSELLSYRNILKDIKNFKRSGTVYTEKSSEFNMFDTPSHKYFKILFYFGSVPEMAATEPGSGLLAPTWELFKSVNINPQDTNSSENNYYNYNSAWSYLKLNNEEERAEKLEHFVTLLSDINSNSPWYFSSIGGMDAALERKSVEDGKIDFTETKKLSITCLPDAFDNRISTLLDLYRDITWSWVHKKEIIPANLRKFDMAVYIFESAVNNMHNDNDIIGSENEYKVSYKMVEFHDCEINYNSIKTGFSEMSNEAGFSPKYTIEISYNDCYEISYNDMMMRKIGDIILTDLLNSTTDVYYDSKPQSDIEKFRNEFNNRMWAYYDKENKEQDKITRYFGNINNRKGNAVEDIKEQQKTEYNTGFLMNAVGQVAGHLKADVKSFFNRAILGNIHTYSLTRIGDQVNELMQGNLIKTGMTVSQYIKNSKQRKLKQEQPVGNIFKNSLANNI